MITLFFLLGFFSGALVMVALWLFELNKELKMLESIQDAKLCEMETIIGDVVDE